MVIFICRSVLFSLFSGQGTRSELYLKLPMGLKKWTDCNNFLRNALEIKMYVFLDIGLNNDRQAGAELCQAHYS